ncbi:YhgE/Pip domain-containing protein [Metabacillus iocasae]
MMKNSTIRSEFSALFTNKKLLIPVLAVLFIPLLYAGMFLWAFWDPYDQLDELPVAIVNSDTGATLNEEPLNVGDELVTKLKDNAQFKWKFVDEKTAKKGLEDQTYYMVIEIPENFSQHATTLQDDQPMHMDLVYTPNESFNFLSAQIGGTAVEKIKEEVSNELTKTYAEEVFSKIEDVSDGLVAASDGAEELNDGINKVKDGSGELKDGITSAKDGTSKLDKGIGEAKDGAGKLSNGLNELNGGIVSAKDGAGEISSGLNEFNSKFSSAKDGASQLNNGLNELNKGVNQLEGGQSQLLEGAKKAENGSQQLSSGLQQSLAGMKEMDGKLPQLNEGTKGISEGANSLARSLEEWQKGAQQTQTGALKVSQGLTDMEKQIDQLINTTEDPQQKQVLQQFKVSVAQLSEGNKQVEGGLQGLTGSASQLKDGATNLASGASRVHQGQVALSNGMKSLLQGQEKLANGAASLTNGQSELVQGLTTFGEKMNEAKAGVSELANGSTELSDGMSRLSEGSNKLANGSSELETGMSRLLDGSNELAKGGTDLSTGLGELSNGSSQLFSGVSRLLEGSNELTSGMGQLSEGSGELSTKLREGADETSNVKANDEVYEMFAKPVDVKEKRVNEVPNYGTGFAPYFLSLGLFVGALLLSIVFPLKEPASVPKNGFSWFIGKFGVLVVVGVLQAILADVVLIALLGIDVQSVPLFVVFSIITSLTYIALIQFLVTTLGDPGRFIAIIILILQLTTSAGTFPLELIPGFLQYFNPLLPMTYSVAGFKAVISSGDVGFMWHNAWILGLFFAATIVGTIIYFTVQHKRQFTNVSSETEVSL